MTMPTTPITFKARVKGQPQGQVYDCTMLDDKTVRIVDPSMRRVRPLAWFEQRFDRVAVDAPTTTTAPTTETKTSTT